MRDEGRPRPSRPPAAAPQDEDALHPIALSAPTTALDHDAADGEIVVWSSEIKRKGGVMEPSVGASVFSDADSRRARLRLVPVGGEAAPDASRAARARPLALEYDASLDEAAATIFAAALDQFCANIPALRDSGDPEAVHQMRVGLRRLRAAISLLRPALTGAALETARERAKSLAAVLGEARDWDVFREMLDAGPRAALGEEPSFYALLDAVELRRADAYRKTRALIEAPEAREFVADLRATLDRRAWRAGDMLRAVGSARDFAGRALTRLRRRAIRKCRGLATLSPERRHEARIALKKARYGAEFFASLYPHRDRARKFSRALADMQDGLGVFNDMQTANRLLDAIDAEHGGRTMRASSFVRGWCAHAAQGGVAHGRKSEKRLRELKPFWR